MAAETAVASSPIRRNRRGRRVAAAGSISRHGERGQRVEPERNTLESQADA